jgi:hypothetical protein
VHHQHLGGRRVEQIDDGELEAAHRIDGEQRRIELGAHHPLVQRVLRHRDGHGRSERERVGELGPQRRPVPPRAGSGIHCQGPGGEGPDHHQSGHAPHGRVQPEPEKDGHGHRRRPERVPHQVVHGRQTGAALAGEERLQGRGGEEEAGVRGQRVPVVGQARRREQLADPRRGHQDQRRRHRARPGEEHQDVDDVRPALLGAREEVVEALRNAEGQDGGQRHPDQEELLVGAVFLDGHRPGEDQGHDGGHHRAREPGQDQRSGPTEEGVRGHRWREVGSGRAAGHQKGRDVSGSGRAPPSPPRSARPPSHRPDRPPRRKCVALTRPHPPLKRTGCSQGASRASLNPAEIPPKHADRL